MSRAALLLSGAIRRFERFSVRRKSLPDIPGSKWNLALIDRQVYKGREIQLPDGVRIRKGSHVAELHLNNFPVSRMDLDLRMILRIMREELNALGEARRSHPDYAGIEAFYCRTLLHSMLIRQGFTAFEIRNPFLRIFLYVWENTLRQVFSYQQEAKNPRQAMECWISADKIMSRRSPQQ